MKRNNIQENIDLGLFHRIYQQHTVEWKSYQSIIVLFIPFILIAITLAAYWPGLGGIFILDDFHVLERLNDYGGVTNSQSFLHYIFNDKSGITGRPISMSSFLIDDQYWPGDPGSFKYTNLLLHISCGLLLFLLFYKIALMLKLQQTSSLIIASLAAALWLLHPLNVSTTLYVVQRMTQLMTLFTIVGLLFFIYGRTLVDTSLNRGIVLMSLSLFPFGLLSFLSKENGVLILFYILVLEFTLFNKLERPKNYKLWLGIAIGIPVVILVGLFIIKWNALTGGFHVREYSQYERVLTESRILITYISYILLPKTAGISLLHDDIIISSGLFSPITTILSILFIIASLSYAIIFRKRFPVISFAILWFYSGHLLESTFLNLELYFEHRNYLPMAGFLFAFFYYLFIGLSKLPHPKSQRLFYLAATMAMLVVFSQTYKLSNIWSKPDNMFPTWTEEHPESLRAKKMYAQYLALNGKSDIAIKVLTETSIKFPEDITSALNSVILTCKYSIPDDITLESILNRLPNIRYSDGILAGASELIDLHFQKQCATFNLEQLHKLLYGLAEVPSIAGKRRVMSRLLFLHANVYVKEGNLSQTMALLDQANNKYPGVSIPLYQAWLLGSAGLYKEAIEYLDIAEKADANRKFPAPSRMQEISTIKQHYFRNLH